MRCAVLCCKSDSNNKNDDISFHRFPTCPEIRRKWSNATGRTNWEPTKSTTICSIHFSKQTIVKLGHERHLIPNTIPTLNINSPCDTTKKNFETSRVCLTSPGQGNLKKRRRLILEPQNIIEVNTGKDADLPGQCNPKKRRCLIIESCNTPKNNDNEMQNITANRNPEQYSQTSINPKIDLQFSPSGTVENFSSQKPKTLLSKSESNIVSENNKLKIRLASTQKKIHSLTRSNRRLQKKNAELKNILENLKSRINSEELDLLASFEKENTDFLKPRPSSSYSPTVKKFALCLNFISPRAYRFVRNKFNTCLPHPRTLCRWYSCIDGEPGFTKECFEALKIVSKKSPLLVCLSLDEMSIRQHVQWNGKQSVGYVNMGQNLESDSLPLAKDALVFLVTALNSNFKLPVGYFLTNGVNGEQRSNLLKNCVTLLTESGVKVVAVTFDGCPSNLSMAKHLGAKICDLNDLDPTITIAGQKIVVYPDPCHMVKLVRNTLADKVTIIDPDQKEVSWVYIKSLHELQESKGGYLANKLRKAHVNYKKQIMKVRLAVQTLSKSVAESLAFCKDELKLEDFQGAGPTIKFIEIMNNIFDILNSRNLNCYGFKKPILKNNFHEVLDFFQRFESYVRALRFPNGELVLNSGRKTGFLGLLLCTKAITKIFYNHVDLNDSPLKFLSTYKLSQDHLELFFSAIRSKGGFNNNPTAIQFQAAYKRLVIHGELKHLRTGNSIPLESTNILTCSKSSIDRKINSTRCRLEAMEDNFDEEQDLESEIPEGHDYIANSSGLSEFSKEITIYVAGYVIKNMKKIIKCSDCLASLISPIKYHGLISHRDVGGLHYPSQDVIDICIMTENTLRNFLARNGHSSLSKKDTVPKMVCHVLKKCLGRDVFPDLTEHIKSQDPFNSHITLLIKAICFRYLEIKIHFLMKTISTKDDRIRNMHTKLILFKGQ